MNRNPKEPTEGSSGHHCKPIVRMAGEGTYCKEGAKMGEVFGAAVVGAVLFFAGFVAGTIDTQAVRAADRACVARFNAAPSRAGARGV